MMKDPENIFAWAMVLGFIAGIIIGVYALFQAMAASGEVSFCFVESYAPAGSPQTFRLRGYRPWRTDSFIGNYPTLSETAAAAESLGCTIGHK